MAPVFYLTFSFFFIGIVSTVLINRKDTGERRRKRWIKFWVYFAVVHGVIISILLGNVVFQSLLLGIILISIFEIIKVWYSAQATGIALLLSALAILLIDAAGMYGFANMQYVHALYVYGIVITFDGFSQVAGQMFGKTKIWPSVSPGKTVEGVFGGFLVSMVSAILLHNFPHYTITRSVILAVSICFFSFAGDMLASMYKRKNGVKDFSQLIPEHGGVLDRFDSLLTAGAAYFFILYFTSLVK